MKFPFVLWTGNSNRSNSHHPSDLHSIPRFPFHRLRNAFVLRLPFITSDGRQTSQTHSDTQENRQYLPDSHVVSIKKQNVHRLALVRYRCTARASTTKGDLWEPTWILSDVGGAYVTVERRTEDGDHGICPSVRSSPTRGKKISRRTVPVIARGKVTMRKSGDPD